MPIAPRWRRAPAPGSSRPTRRTSRSDTPWAICEDSGGRKLRSSRRRSISSVMKPIDDVRIREIKEVSPPDQVLRELPASEEMAAAVFAARQAIHRILVGGDDRLLVVIGPCSIHDPRSALEYAARLRAEAERLGADLLVVLRGYFEEPRTNVGWEGPLHHPRLDRRLAS